MNDSAFKSSGRYESALSALLANSISHPPRSVAGLLSSPGPYDTLLSQLAQTIYAQPQTLVLQWRRCEGNEWGGLTRLYLDWPYFDNRDGVYVIWSTAGVCVRIGQGHIRDRLTAHRLDDDINAWCPAGGELLVTWADVDVQYRDGVEGYLADRLRPVVGTRFPLATPITVNLPW